MSSNTQACRSMAHLLVDFANRRFDANGEVPEVSIADGRFLMMYNEHGEINTHPVDPDYLANTMMSAMQTVVEMLAILGGPVEQGRERGRQREQEAGD